MNLYDYSKHVDKSITELAEFFEIRPSTLYTYLQGTRMPRLDSCFVLVTLSGGLITYKDLLKDVKNITDIAAKLLAENPTENPSETEINKDKRGKL